MAASLVGMADEQETQRNLQTRNVGFIPRVRVTVISGRDAGRVFEPPETIGGVSIGVSEDNRIVLTDPTVSRYHLEIDRTEAGLVVNDLGSLNGTFLGAVQLRQAVLPAGTRLQLGQTTLEIGDSLEASSTDALDVAIPGLVGDSPVMHALRAQVAKLAPSNASVLIQGETGTGKEVFARSIHQLGPRREQPFQIVDCGSLPSTLIASELFGHERGAFTGADARQAGAFELAHGGTLLLDEIGELPLAVQPALLGVLERRRFRRVGGQTDINTDIRVLAATNRDLRAEVNRGNFRADLYFRLAVVRLVLPPLRERREDIPALIAHFVKEVAGDGRLSPITRTAIEALKAHPWGGNLRELRNVVEAAVTMGQISVEEAGVELPAATASSSGGSSSGRSSNSSGSPSRVVPYKDARAKAIAAFEKDYVTEVIEACGGNVSEAARRAQMDRSYLFELMKKAGVRG